MALYYCAGFQVTSADPGNMACTVNAGSATIGSGYYLPGYHATADYVARYTASSYSAPEGQAYTPFSTAVSAAFSAAAGFAVTVSWSASTGLYTISSGSSFSLTFAASDSNRRLRRALGFNGNKGSATSHVSDFVPHYVMESAVGGRTDVVGPYEPDDVAEESVSDGGQDFVITRRSNERLMTWVQQMESKTAVYETARNAANAPDEVAWTWEAFFRHLRGSHPFAVSNEGLDGDGSDPLFRLTARGASFRPRRYSTDDETYWVIPFEARYLGARYV